MKVKIKARRYLGGRGERMVHLEVVEVNDPKLTSKIFADFHSFALRKIVGGNIEVGGTLENEGAEYYFYADVEVNDDADKYAVERMIEEIGDLYKNIIRGKKGWAGEKEYELEI